MNNGLANTDANRNPSTTYLSEVHQNILMITRRRIVQMAIFGECDTDPILRTILRGKERKGARQSFAATQPERNWQQKPSLENSQNFLKIATWDRSQNTFLQFCTRIACSHKPLSFEKKNAVLFSFCISRSESNVCKKLEISPMSVECRFNIDFRSAFEFCSVWPIDGDEGMPYYVRIRIVRILLQSIPIYWINRYGLHA